MYKLSIYYRGRKERVIMSDDIKRVNKLVKISKRNGRVCSYKKVYGIGWLFNS
jgi:hypothetical protein